MVLQDTFMVLALASIDEISWINGREMVASPCGLSCTLSGGQSILFTGQWASIIPVFYWGGNFSLKRDKVKLLNEIDFYDYLVSWMFINSFKVYVPSNICETKKKKKKKKTKIISKFVYIIIILLFIEFQESFMSS